LFLAIFGAYMKKGLGLITVSLCLLVYLSNCNKTNTVAPSALRVFNIDYTLQPQDMYLNNQVQATNIAYANDNSYVSVLPGTYNIKFAPAGSSNFNADYNIDFSTGKNYLMFLFGSGSQLQSEAFDVNPLTLGIDTSEIRFFNFSPNAPLMDIGIKNTDTSKLDTTYTIYTHRYFNDIYSNRLLTNFLIMPSGTYSFKLRYADTTLAFDSIQLTLGDRRSYTILARGNYGSTPAFRVDTLQH